VLAETFLDTNVLVYAAYPRENETWKRDIALDLIARERYATSTQVMLEFLNVTTRKRKPGLNLDQARSWLVDLSVSPVVGADDSLVLEAIDLATRYNIVFWDGAIVAAANRAGARILYTEDFNTGQRYGDVTAVNPFLPQAH
jgi:predicted nucleic acid-binding protein